MNIKDEILKDIPFAKNYKETAPVLFSYLIKDEEALKLVRDETYIEEVLKTKSIVDVLLSNIDSENLFDLIEYSTSVAVLREKIKVLKALQLHTRAEQEKEEKTIKLDISGTEYEMEVDLELLKKAITFKKVEKKNEEEKKAESPAEEVKTEKKSYAGISDPE